MGHRREPVLGQMYFELRFLQSGADCALCSLVEWLVSRSQYKVRGKPSLCSAAKCALPVSSNSGWWCSAGWGVRCSRGKDAPPGTGPWSFTGVPKQADSGRASQVMVTKENHISGTGKADGPAEEGTPWFPFISSSFRWSDSELLHRVQVWCDLSGKNCLLNLKSYTHMIE